MRKNKLILLLLSLAIACSFAGCQNINKNIVAVTDNYRSFYEVFIYSYCDSDEDGIGDINGLTSKLDYIADMGFNGIWLMPIHQSPTYHKYDVDDYYSIDKTYGTMEDFENFLLECDKRNIKVIMDLVLNHTSINNKWFTEAAWALQQGNYSNKYIDYYHFSKKDEGGYHKTGNHYYEGKFWSGMPDLNLDCEGLRAEIKDIMQFWLDKGVHGFRLDAVKEFFSGNTTKNIETLAWIADTAKELSPDCYIIGENWDTTTGSYEYYKSGIDSFFDFRFAAADGITAKTVLDSRKTAKDFCDSMLVAQEQIEQYSESGMEAQFFVNHDTARAAGFLRSDPATIKLAWGMTMLQGGVSFMYYGEELGMKGSGKDENKRAPMQWDSKGKAEGITAGPPQMDKVEHPFEGAAQQQKDKSSIQNYVKQTLAIRNEIPSIARGRIVEVKAYDNPDVCAVKRDYDGDIAWVFYNLTDKEQKITANSEEYGVDGTFRYVCAQKGKASYKGDKLTLPPMTIAVLD